MTATQPPPPPPAGTRELVDQLVPPPWSRGQRSIAVATVTVIVVAIGALWWSGVLGPNLGPVRGYGYGALEQTELPTGTRGGTVELQLEIANRGWFPVRDFDVQAPPFSAGSFGLADGPVDLGPRGRQQVTFHLVVEDCSRFLAAPFPGLSYTGTSNGVPARMKSLRVLGADHVDGRPTWPDAREPEVSSWWYELARSVCDPDGFLHG